MDNQNPFSETNNDINNEILEELNEQQEELQEENNDEIENEEVQEETSENDIKYEELNNKYIRLAADFDNFRKRTISEKEELSTYTKIEVLKKITTALDTFDRAQEHLKEIDDCVKVKEGYEVAYKQLLDILSKLGLSEIEALGADFNPSEHEAITQVPTNDFEPDKVALVAQKGYKLGDKVVRPALVGVAVKPQE